MDRSVVVRLRVVLLGIALMLAGGPGSPAAGTGPSPWAGPWSPTVSEARAQQFVDLWDGRVTDEAWFGEYLQAESFPNEVLAEGFHGLDVHTKMYLIDRLFDRLAETMPQLRAEVAQANGIDDPKLDGQKNVLYMFVFDKEWVKQLRADSKVTPTDAPAFELSDELTRKLETLRPIQPIVAPAAVVPEELEHPAARTVDMGPPVRGSGTLPLNDPGVLATLPLPDQPPDVSVPPRPGTEDDDSPLGLGTYRVCTASPTKGRSCTADVVLNLPTDVDVDGSGGPDVRAVLSLGGVELNALSVVFEITRLNPASGPLPGYVTASQDVLLAGKRVEVGFESPASLSNTSTLRVRLNDLAAAIGGNTSLTAAISHTGSSNPSGLRFRVGDIDFFASVPGSLLNPAESSPTQGVLLFDPAPANSQVTVDLNRAAGQDQYRLQYSASVASALDGLIEIFQGPTASAALRRRIEVAVNDLPTSVSLTMAMLASGQVTAQYTASSVIGSASVVDTSFASPGDFRVVTAAATGIPASMKVSFTPPLALTYEASSIMPTAGLTIADYAGGVLQKTFSGAISDVPANVTLDASGLLQDAVPSVLTYQASSSVTQAVVSYSKINGEAFNATLQGLPTSIEATVDMAGAQILWVADGPVGSVTGNATILSGGRTWRATLALSGIPARWEASFSSGHAIFRGISGPLVSAAGTLTNHGTVTTFPGNHLSAVFRSASGDLDASFRIGGINLIDVQKTTGGFDANVQIGAGGLLFLNADLIDGATKALLQSTITPMPSSVRIIQAGESITYTSSANFDINIYAEVGNVGGAAAAPAPPLVVGLSLRDGNGCSIGICGNGFKGRALIFGFPTAASVTPTATGGPRITLTNFRPPAATNFLVADVELDNVTTPLLDLFLVQSGIPSPISFTFGPIATETITGGKRTSLTYTATGGMGPLTADIIKGTDVGRLSISNIPTSISATISLVNGTSTAVITLGQTIGNITAQFRRTSDVSFLGTLSLSQVPTSVDLSFGRVTFTSGGDEFTVPGMRYRANASTLDMTADIQATLMGGDVMARLTALISNLGATTDVFLSGSNLRLVSSPATTLIEIHTWGRIRYLRSFSGCVPSSCPTFRLRYSGHAGVVPLTINDLGLRVTSLSDLNIRLGITTGIDGAYGVLQFGWASMTVTVDIEASVDACVSGFCIGIVSAGIHGTFPLNVLFHGGTNHSALWFHWNTPLPCSFFSTYDMHVDIRPHPHFAQFNGFAISPPGAAEGNAWTVTPNPNGILPSFAVQVAAALTSPYGGGFSVSFPCH